MASTTRFQSLFNPGETQRLIDRAFEAYREEKRILPA